MNGTILLVVCVGIISIASLSSAYPQRVYVQKLPYYPPPTRASRPIRVRRSPDNAPLSNGVSIATNSAAGNLYKGDSNRLDAKVIQSQTHFPSGKVSESSSGSVDWTNAYGIGASVSRDINKGVSDTFTKSLTANLYNNDKNRLDAIYSQSHIKQDNGFKFDKTSGLLNWSNSDGHGLNAGLSRYDGFGKQASVGGHANLFTSNDGNTRVNAFGTGSKWLSGPLESHQEFGFGIGGSHSFPG